MQFLDTLRYITNSILPLVAIIVLLMLGIFIYRLLKVLKSLTQTVDKVNKTIDVVDSSIAKLQTPLNTFESLAHTVNTVHMFSDKAVRGFVANLSEIYQQIVEFITGFFGSEEKTTSTVNEEVVVYDRDE